MLDLADDMILIGLNRENDESDPLVNPEVKLIVMSAK